MNRIDWFVRICWIAFFSALVLTIFLGLASADSDLSDYKKVDACIQSQNTRFYPDLIRAIAWVESGWNQKENNGRDVGVMQIDIQTIDRKKINIKRLKSDMKYNIKIGCDILEDKYRWAIEIKKDHKRMNELCRKYNFNFRNLTKLQLAALAYNGIKADQTYWKCVFAIEDSKPWEKILGLREN